MLGDGATGANKDEMVQIIKMIQDKYNRSNTAKGFDTSFTTSYKAFRNSVC